MRLIKLQLSADNPFYFFNNISLTPVNKVSQFFDIDELDREDFDSLNKSIKTQNIKAFNKDGNRILDLTFHNIAGGATPKNLFEDVDIKVEDLPDIISITCDDEELKEEEVQITEEDRKEANIILSTNGNTARKIIYNFSIDKNSIGIIKACLEIELQDKNRKGILKAIQERLEEYESNKQNI